MDSQPSSPPNPSGEADAGAGRTPAHSLVARAVAQAAEPFAVARADGALVFVNAAMLEAAGLDARGTRPADIFRLFALFCEGEPDDPAREMGEAAREARPFSREVVRPATGQTFALDVRPVTRPPAAEGDASPRGAAGGRGEAAELLGFAFAARDVTRRREAERLRGAALSLVSHELRTPLTSISGFAELLAADGALPAETREFLSIIRDESLRLTRMVNVFLSGEGGGHDADEGGLRLAPLSLDEVARAAVAGLGRAARGKGIRLVCEDGPRLPPVAADESLVSRAAASLLADALGHAPSGATVRVSTDLETDAVRLAIEISPAPTAVGANSTPCGDLADARDAAERHGGRLLREHLDDTLRLVFTLPRM